MTEDDSWLEGGPLRVPVHGLDKRELAEALGKPLKAIDKLVRDGLPARSTGSKRGGLRFDLPTVVEWLQDQARGDEDTITEAKRRLALATASRRELENAKLQNEVIPTSLVLRVIDDRYIALRKRLQNIGTESFSLTRQQYEDLRKAMDDALSDVSQTALAEDLQIDLDAFYAREEPSGAD